MSILMKKVLKRELQSESYNDESMISVMLPHHVVIMFICGGSRGGPSNLK